MSGLFYLGLPLYAKPDSSEHEADFSSASKANGRAFGTDEMQEFAFQKALERRLLRRLKSLLAMTNIKRHCCRGMKQS
ncbi:hypothetical protein [Pedobacter cryotolerans]|uniref:hypothetical protein n=1 Tax=Pedobacter cryotolerans TaxID=2571270 RepID=UPI00197EE0AE|nr:hypothetical protein [Pedobacter cryotolerans]